MATKQQNSAGSTARRSAPLRYGAALGIWLATLGLQFLFHDAFLMYPFMLSVAAVLITALYLGFGPSLLVTALASLAATYLVFTPGTLYSSTDEGVTLALFAAVGTGAAWLVVRRERAEAAHRASEERFRSLADAMPQLIWSALPDGTVDYYNRRVEEFGGIARLPDGTWQWSPVLHENDLETTVNAWNEAVRTGRMYEIRHRIRMADGTYRWCLSRGVPVRDAEGQILRWYGTATDVHEQTLVTQALQDREADLERLNETLELRVRERTGELERSQEALRQSERLAAIGQMMTGLSHESRNALQRALACVEMLDRRLKDQPLLHQLVNELRKAQDDLLRVYENVQDYARPMTLQCVPVDMAKLWREAWAKLAGRLDRDAVLNEELDEGDRHCMADPHLFEQVFRNLFDNALAAGSDPVEICVRCSTVAGDDGGSLLRIALRDNGPGVPEAVRPMLFEPFYTTKTKGTGLGLPLVRRIVELHGGRVGLGPHDAPGFEVLLDLPKAQEGAHAQGPHFQGHETEGGTRSGRRPGPE